VGNELRVGESRVGQLIDGNEATPEIRTQLQRSADGRVILFVPWTGGGPEEPYRRWFAGTDTNFGDDPDRTRYAYEVPANLLFHDHLGPVALLGCSSAGYSENWGWDMGAGRARVRYAVLGGRSLSYATINGMRTSVTGLHSWLGATSIRQTESIDPRRSEYHIELAPSTTVDGVAGLTLEPSFRRTSGNEGETVLSESTLVQTLWEEPRSWNEHWRVHRAVRDLVAVAAWRNERFTSASVSRDDDPLRVATGDAVGRAWHEVIAPEVSEGEISPRRTSNEFMFRSGDLRSDALASWIALRDKHSRAIDPIVSALNLQSGTVEVALAMVGIGMEALGYELALATRSKTAANDLSLAKRLELIANSLPVQPPFDVGEWVAGTSEAYNGIKHANRDMPEPVDQLNRVRESRLVFRMWVAAQLGMSTDELLATLKHDPMTNPYVPAATL